MINIPVEVGANLSTGGIEIHSWVGDYDGDGIFYSWSTLVRELIEGYTIPNSNDKLMLNKEDYEYLLQVAKDINGAAASLVERLYEAKVV